VLALAARARQPRSHDQILTDAIGRARAKLEYTNLSTWLLDEPLTIAELRRTCEAVWGRPPHPANFRRKVLATTAFVTPTGETAATGRSRAERYPRGRSAQLHPALLRPACTRDDHG
jgi:8-oxo-dGTP diphosphatase